MRNKILIELNAYIEEYDENEFQLVLAHPDLEDALTFRSNSEKELEMLLEDLNETPKPVVEPARAIPMGSSIWPNVTQQVPKPAEPVRTVTVSQPSAPVNSSGAIDQMAGDVLDIKSLWKKLRST
ncbi:hypothetical protein D3C87_460300 [compost metagenome]